MGMPFPFVLSWFILVDFLQKVGICALARKDKSVVFWEFYKREVFDFHSSIMFVANSESPHEMSLKYDKKDLNDEVWQNCAC